MTENRNLHNPITRIRRNHALEHATLAILQQKGVRGALGGISGPNGFWIFGKIDPTALQDAVEEALKRLRKGEKRLAISPNCGSNYAVPGMLAALVSWIVMMVPGKDSFKSKFDRLPLMMLLVTFVLIFSRPLAALVQEKLVTDPHPGEMKVASIMIYTSRNQYFQHIHTKQ